MPEGHTIHRLAGRHREMFAGEPVQVSSPQGRFTEGAAVLDGTVLRDVEAYGKHLLYHFPRGHSLHVHLGLIGFFTDGAAPAPAPAGQVRLRLANQRHWADLRGPTACELFTQAEVEALRDRLGEDPLRNDADPTVAYRKISRSSRSLAALLLDQSVVAGPGLVYVSEVLFRAGIAPTRPGSRCSLHEWEQLWQDLRELMKEGVASGRIDTVHSQHMPEAMGRAPRQDRHGGEVYVYRRAGQPCLICGTEVRRSGLAGRNSFWCPTCQPG